MRKLRDSLCDVIEAERGLLAHLLSQSVLTFRQFDEVRSKRTALERSSKLIVYLLDSYKGDYEKVMGVFNECGQEHVVNFVTAGGGTRAIIQVLGFFSSEFGCVKIQ